MFYETVLMVYKFSELLMMFYFFFEPARMCLNDPWNSTDALIFL